jgi:hypothetical protein
MDENKAPASRHGDAYKQFTKWLGSTGVIKSPQPANAAMYQRTVAFKLGDYFDHLAKTRLPITMGEKYFAGVVTCLTCLDKENGDSGDEEGVLVAVRFIETILLKLNEINV